MWRRALSNFQKARLKATVVAAAPAALLAALVAHPHLAGRLPNDAAVAAAVLADPVHWGLSHLAAAVASGLIAVAFLCVRNWLRAAGEVRWSGPALAFIILGSTLCATLPGMEFAPLAAARTGADVEAAQAALGPWFVPVLFSAALVFGAGALGFAAGALGSAAGIIWSGALAPGPAAFVAAALVVMAASRFVPFAVVQFHVHGLAALAALWPLAVVMWKTPAGAVRHPSVHHELAGRAS